MVGKEGDPGRHDGGDEEPEFDIPDGFVFDEEFVRGGVHEPPARTRAAIAQYGQGKSSWRHPAPNVAAGRRPKNRRGWFRRHWVSFLAAAVAVIVVAVVVVDKSFSTNGVPNLAGVPSQPARTTLAPASGGTVSSAVPTVNGVNDADRPGTCFTADVDPTSDQPMTLTKVDCATAHDLELTGIVAAAGDDATYPNETYWRNSVAPTCDQTLSTFTGKALSDWPASWHSFFLRPTPTGWQVDDRRITCMLRTAPRATGSAVAK